MSGSVGHGRAFWLPIAILTAAAILWSVRRIHDERPWLAESIAMAAMLLLSPVSWVHHWILVLPFLVACFRLAGEDRSRRVLPALTYALTAALWFGIVWRVPNTHDREYHHNLWQFLVGNSDVLLLLATLTSVVVATSALSRVVRSGSMR